LHFTLASAVQPKLELPRYLNIDFAKIDIDRDALEAALRGSLGPSESDRLRVVVQDVFYIGGRPGPTVVVRQEAGEAVPGQAVIVESIDGRAAEGQVVGLESLHAGPGLRAILVSVDDPSMLVPGTIIRAAVSS
jgi:hypothetical protein